MRSYKIICRFSSPKETKWRNVALTVCTMCFVSFVERKRRLREKNLDTNRTRSILSLGKLVFYSKSTYNSSFFLPSQFRIATVVKHFVFQKEKNIYQYPIDSGPIKRRSVEGKLLQIVNLKEGEEENEGITVVIRIARFYYTSGA